MITAVIANLGMIIPEINYNILLQTMEEIELEQKNAVRKVRHKVTACDFTLYCVRSAILAQFPTEASYTTSAVSVCVCVCHLIDFTVRKVWHSTH